HITRSVPRWLRGRPLVRTRNRHQTRVLARTAWWIGRAVEQIAVMHVSCPMGARPRDIPPNRYGTKRTSRSWRNMSAFGGKADIGDGASKSANDPKRTWQPKFAVMHNTT